MYSLENQLKPFLSFTNILEMARTEVIEIKAYSKRELADLYKIGVRSITTWLEPFKKDVGTRHGRYYSPKQVRIIFEKLGLPGD